MSDPPEIGGSGFPVATSFETRAQQKQCPVWQHPKIPNTRGCASYVETTWPMVIRSFPLNKGSFALVHGKNISSQCAGLTNAGLT